jgi:hypothetical protein
MKKTTYVLSVIVCSIICTACLVEGQNLFRSIAEVRPLPTLPISEPTAGDTSPSHAAFLESVSVVADEARYASKVKQTFNLTTDEMALLKNNGFVVSDRLAFEDFSNAYAYIYWKDLPVLITTDSILHAIHKTYDDLLMRLEAEMLAPQLVAFLTKVRQQVRTEAGANTDPELASLYSDVESYLSVPLALFATTAQISAEATRYLGLAQQANSMASVTLFGGKRQIDFSLFKPRGHYLKREQLGRYFQAMSWLAHIDFRLVEYDSTGKPRLNVNHLAAAVLLHQAISSANQRTTWQAFDNLISAFVGRSDNMTLRDLERFLADAGIKTAGDVLSKPTQLLALLTSGDYGQQQIVGQLLKAAPDKLQQPLPVSLMLAGQRFAIDSYIISQLVYDRLLVKGRKVQRPLPSPLDVMYALGNDQAKTHLQSELAQYGYQNNLNSLRAVVEGYDASFWTSTAYNRWLSTLRALNVNTTNSAYPQAMRTAAWADKMLHTQLASWTQLRHDNVLYVKHSSTFRPFCEYPTGYVEPYPAFYAAVRDYAQAGRKALASIKLGLSAENLKQLQPLRQTALAYFDHLESVATMLHTLAEKELRLEPFSPEELAFLKDTTILQKERIGCGELREEWNGWYPKLFPWEDDSPALIADIHSNPNADPRLAPPGVLHVATGPVAAMIFIADTDEGATMYVGPSFTYYEVVEKGLPLVRLTDKDWMRRLYGEPHPTPPNWTASFRLPVSQRSRHLSVPAQWPKW